MKVLIWDIMNDYSLDIQRATDRIKRMRYNDASSVAFIIRKIIYNGYYDPATLSISFREDFVIPEITYDDIATISRFMSRKPFNHGYEGISKLAAKIEDVVRWRSKVGEEKGGEQ